VSEQTGRRVVIVGGGFGGVFTAKHLRRRAGSDVRIELISRNNFLVFQPLLPEVAGGSIHPADAVSPLRLFLPGVSVRVADVRKIDVSTKTVHMTAGHDPEITVVPYDQLVIALGQVVDPSRTPGLAERALVMKDVIDAFHIRNRVLGCLEDADTMADPRSKRRLLTFVVIGGGFTGVETVGEMQELIRKGAPPLSRHPPARGEDRPDPARLPHPSRIAGASVGLRH
jgi:NADH:ubiquinone reductase (H+-translocating)